MAVHTYSLNFTEPDLPARAAILPIPAALGTLVEISSADLAAAAGSFLTSAKNEVSFLLVRELAVVVVPRKRLVWQALPSAAVHCALVFASGEPKSLPA